MHCHLCWPVRSLAGERDLQSPGLLISFSVQEPGGSARGRQSRQAHRTESSNAKGGCDAECRYLCSRLAGMDSHPLLQTWSQALRSRHLSRVTASPMIPPWWCWGLALAPGPRCSTGPCQLQSICQCPLHTAGVPHGLLMSSAQSCTSATACCLPDIPVELSASAGRSSAAQRCAELTFLPPVHQAKPVGIQIVCHADRPWTHAGQQEGQDWA